MPLRVQRCLLAMILMPGCHAKDSLSVGPSSSAPDLSLGTPRRPFLVSSPRMEADGDVPGVSSLTLDSFPKQNRPARSCGFLDFLGLFRKLALTF